MNQSPPTKRLRIVNDHGLAVFTRVWLDDVEVTASLSRLVIDVEDGCVVATLRFPMAAVEYEGEAVIEAAS